MEIHVEPRWHGSSVGEALTILTVIASDFNLSGLWPAL
jgi:hypothetical protein